MFALSNGHIGMRGNLDEGEPHGLPGMYLNSVYELRPLPYAEAGYGYPESGQSMVNITNGKIIRLLVDDEPFDVRYGTLEEHERVLDLRDGRLTRNVVWRSPAGSRVRIRSERLVSLSQRSVAAISYEVEAVGQPLRVVLQSELVANEPLPPAGKDPRVAAVLDAPLVCEDHVVDELGAVLVHRTKQSGLRVAAAMDHEIDGPDDTLTDVDAFPDIGRLTVATRLQPGQKLRLVKYLAYGWSSRRSRSAVHDQVAAAVAGARLTGWDGLCKEQCDFLDEYWEGADVEVEGDADIQQAVRFAMFHVLQAGARAEQRPIAAKGLTGTGYDGHTFWDTEVYVLPVLIYTYPQAAAHALAWRGLTLPLAIERAEQLNLEGAAFPWRTIRGQECSAYWPAGTAAFHINAGRRRRGRAVPRRDRGSGVRGGVRRRAARAHRAAVAQSRPPRPRGSVPHRRRDRSRRVQRGRRQQRVHEPHGPTEPGVRGRGRVPQSDQRRRARSDRRGGGIVARRRHQHVHPVRRAASVCTRRARASPTTTAGTSSTRPRATIRCSSTTRTSSSTGCRW